MIVKNEFVKIKQKNNVVELHNLILNKYLELFSRTQYESETELEDDNGQKRLTVCLIKFDTPIENINENIELSQQDFDIQFSLLTQSVEFNNQEASIMYNYGRRESNGIYVIATEEYVDNLEDFLGKKITAIGFGSYNDIYTIVDTTNYSLIVEDSDSFNVFRKDNFKSDAVCSDYPYHLSPIGKGSIQLNEEGTTAYVYAKLYSVGLGVTMDSMAKEYIIGKDIDVNVIDDTTFSFNLKKGDVNNIFTRSSLQPTSSKYPLALYVNLFKFPSSSKFAYSNIYPAQTDYRYIIYKYRLYYFYRSGLVELDEYYTMSYLTDVKGLFEIETKIERNDD